MRKLRVLIALTFHSESEHKVRLGANVLHELLDRNSGDGLGLLLLLLLLHLLVLLAEVREFLSELLNVEDLVSLARLSGLRGVNLLLGAHGSGVLRDRFI